MRDKSELWSIVLEYCHIIIKDDRTPGLCTMLRELEDLKLISHKEWIWLDKDLLNYRSNKKWHYNFDGKRTKMYIGHYMFKHENLQARINFINRRIKMYKNEK